MRDGMRIVRFLVGMVITAVMVLSAVGYVVYATNGILDEVAAQDRRDRYDRLIVGTATALAERLTAVKQGVYVSPTDDRATAVDTVTLTFVPSATPVVATDTPVPTDTLVPTGTPTDVLTATATVTVLATFEPVQVAATHTPSPTMTPTATSTPTATATWTATTAPSITPIPTNTPRPTVTPIPTNTMRPTVTTIPTITPVPTATMTYTPTPTPTPTFTATVIPTATYVIEGTYALPYEPPVVPIPPPAPFVDHDPDVVNILLLGSDTTAGRGVGHTDVMVIVSVNKRAGTVALWHIPRDIFVYVPNYTMERLNLAFALGEGNGYVGGGFGLMKETIRYNFGIEVDHYARVDFDGYMAIIDELGGLDISVDCAIADWRLIAPDLDPMDEANWEYYTLPIGRQRLSPYMALWYARSRKTTNDLDRGRRQVDVLRAMWYQARDNGLFAQVVQLWPQAIDVVETDMQLTDVLSLVPLAVSLDMSNIVRYSGTQGVHYQAFVTPDDGREVMLPVREALLPLIEDFLTPPTANRLGRQAITVEVIDASAYGLGFDAVAVDRLAWEGFAARLVVEQIDHPREVTVIYDFTGQTKGNVLDELRQVLRVGEGQVVQQPDPDRAVDFRVEIGGAYNACVYGNIDDAIGAGPPVPTAEATPN